MAEYIIPNLKNACRILEFLGHSARALTCLEISRALSLPRTSVMRIMETLASERFVKKEEGKYSIGGALANLGDSSLAQMNLLNIAEPYLAKLTGITGETSHLALPLHAASRAGAVVDMYCSGTGKVLLAWLAKNDASFLKKVRLERRTANTITNKEILQKELALTLRRGYAIDNEEYHIGVRCLAVPVYDKLGGVVGALGITAPAVRFDRRSNARMYEIVNAVALELSKRLGYSGK